MAHRGSWSRISLTSKLRLIALGGFLLFAAVAVVMPETEESRQRRAANAAFRARVDDRSVTLGDWERASPDQKAYFCSAYARAHLGVDNTARANDIRAFLDGSAEKLRAAAPRPEVVDGIFERQDLWMQARAGARLLGWPKSRDTSDDAR